MRLGVELYLGETVLIVYARIHLNEALLCLNNTFAPMIRREKAYEIVPFISE